ncbi:hypothetical protein [Arachidicoccus ginsenosidimutans]|uniref:hypothetical protein n=1 Tax=Arachidicoccus sp. BS20 TaxID=1850526 RepID=UPI0012E75A9A|nr:hypothetical protein [Arachidicoccus sp. BS20]
MLTFFCQAFNRVVVYATFYANQNYIEHNLCENRDKPWMHCNGHCQLNKKLADDDKQNTQSPAQRAANEMSVLFFAPVVFQPVIFYEKKATPLNGYYTPIAPQTFTTSAFHPPAV